MEEESDETEERKRKGEGGKGREGDNWLLYVNFYPPNLHYTKKLMIFTNPGGPLIFRTTNKQIESTFFSFFLNLFLRV